MLIRAVFRAIGARDAYSVAALRDADGLLALVEHDVDALEEYVAEDVEPAHEVSRRPSLARRRTHVMSPRLWTPPNTKPSSAGPNARSAALTV
jgi:hypothetical protein